MMTLNRENLIQESENNMKKIIEVLKNKLLQTRTANINTSLLGSIIVNRNEKRFSLNTISSITMSANNRISIIPWDKSMIPFIQKAILSSQLGLNPIISEKQEIKIFIPSLTNERRKELIRILMKEGEYARIAIRKIRRESINFSKFLLKNKNISENEERKINTLIQKMTDKSIKSIDLLLKEKSIEMGNC